MKEQRIGDFFVNQNKKLTFTNRQIFFYLSGILALTLAAYSNSFFNDFTIRDDDMYVRDNPLLRDLSWAGLKAIFTELYYFGHIPLTILSLAADYHLWHLQAVGYHLTNFLLHALNTVLVFFLIRQIAGNDKVSLLSALIFAIHPMGVQSVSWVSERKNVLYAFFFLLSLLQYIRYVKTGKIPMLAISFVFFICSTLSKPASFPLPVILLLIDWYFKRTFSWKIIAEKAIFFAIPFIVYLWYMRSEITFPGEFTFTDRIFLGSYAFLFYTIKAVFPVHLTNIYPYPAKISDHLPSIFYWSFPAAILLVALIIYAARKFSFLRREILFGLLFFLFNISMVLQVLKYIGGGELVADRYGYIPFIGIFFLLSEVIFFLRGKFAGQKKIITGAIAIYIICLGSYTYARNTVWKNSATLYEDAIRKNKDLPMAHMNRAKYFAQIHQEKQALEGYNECIRKYPDYQGCYYWRGVLYYDHGFYEKAKADFTKAIELNPKEKTQFNYLGLIEMNAGHFPESISYFRKVISMDSTYALAYNNLGWSHERMGNYELAERLYSKALQLDPKLSLAYLNRGWLLVEKNEFKKAIQDFNSAEQLEPGNAMIFNNRGYSYYNLKQYAEALKDLNKAITLNADLGFAYYNRAMTYFELNEGNLACKDLKKAAELGHDYSAKLFEERCP